MSDNKISFYRSVGLGGSLQDMEAAFYRGEHVKVPYILAQSAVPVCLAPNGTVATNGIVTLGTALPATYSGGIWLRLPANAIVGGAAGLYWAVMSSTTQGQVYTNFADPASAFTPFIPSGALAAAVGSNVAYTQTTAANITLVNVTIPSRSIGLNGSLRVNRGFRYNTAAGVKVFAILFGGSSVANNTRTTSGGSDSLTLRVSNRGVANSQFTYDSAEASGSASGGSAASINTEADVQVVLIANLDTATNYALFESMCIEVLPS